MQWDSKLNNFLAVTGANPPVNPPANTPSIGSAERELGTKILNFGATSNINTSLQSTITFLFDLAVVLAIVFIVLGAVKLVSSAGNKDKAKDAWDTLKYAFFGLIAAFALNLFLKFFFQIFSTSPSQSSGSGSSNSDIIRTPGHPQ
jgi:hypothetical protein